MRRAEVEKLLKEGWEIHNEKAWDHTWELVNPETRDTHNFDSRTLSYLLKTKKIEKFKEGWPMDRYRWVKK